MVNELGEELNRSTAAVELAIGGLSRMAAEVEALPKFEENSDPSIYVGHGHPAEPGVRPHGVMRVSELVEQAKDGGQAEILLKQQWIVATYSKWEQDYRPRLATAAIIKPRMSLATSLAICAICEMTSSTTGVWRPPRTRASVCCLPFHRVQRSR